MRLHARRRTLLVLGVLLVLVAAPVAVYGAVSHHFSGAAERQWARWTTDSAQTSSTSWRRIRGLSITRCTRTEVAETVTLTLSGGPVRLRGVIDGVPEAPMKPGIVRFVPDGKESVTYTFAANTAPFEADDTHRFDLEWQSPSGAPVKLHAGVANLVFSRGTQGC